MSGGQDEAAKQIESSGDWETPTIEHTWTPEACELRRLLEACKGNAVIESQLKERIEYAEDARDAKAAIDEFRKTLKKENDAMERDTRGPAIVSVGSVNTGLKFYGPFVSIEDAVAWLRDCNLTGATTVSLLESPRKANTTTPQYEPHTMESLLPLAGEWVHLKDDTDAWPLTHIGRSIVRVGDSLTLTYHSLLECTWATGPNKGKPVAREVK